MDSLSDKARQERAEYFRKWRTENKDKVKKINATYWEKRAKKRFDLKNHTSKDDNEKKE